MWKRFKHWLLTWKPIHLCWWFEERGKPIPKYFIAGGGGPPTVVTNAATNIGTTVATGNGDITSDGGKAITERGFVFSDTDSTPTIGEGGVTQIIEGGTATGTYSDTLTPLTNNTLYYYQAYATNSKGTSYGGVEQFTTAAIYTKANYVVAKILATVTQANYVIASLGDKTYTREENASLPTNADDLTTHYSSSEYTNVSADNATRVGVDGTGYILHQFKKAFDNNTKPLKVTWNGRSTLAPSSNTVYLQVYNYNTPGWEAVDSDGTTGADTDFDLEGVVNTNLSYYYTGSRNIACFRVYQAT